MSVLHKFDSKMGFYREAATCKINPRAFRTTPFIITFCDSFVSEFDIHTLIELGLRVVRFKMSHITTTDKVTLLALLQRALKWCCEKYDVSTWPVALCIDLPNACIKTGFLDQIYHNTHTKHLHLKENSTVELTSDIKYWTKCNEQRIFIDDPYTMPSIIPGTEITIDFGEIIMNCVEKIDDKNIKCLVIKGGKMKDTEFVCLRGVKLCKPPITKKDIEIIEFAKAFKFDIIIINSVRNTEVLQKVKALYIHHRPLLISAICEEEGLNNIDDIIKNSDAIILAREFLAHTINDKFKMTSIQLYLTGKCKQYGKPFYLSGNILEDTLIMGRLTGCDLNDITNAVLQGSGFILRKYRNPENLIKAMHILNDICKTVEPLTGPDCENQFWRTTTEIKIPVNAAEAAVISSVLLAKRSNSMVIIVPTVTGRTVKQIVFMAQDIFIIAITADSHVAKQLQLYKGVISIIYDKKPMKDWYLEMHARIKFAVAYGIKFEVLKYGSSYVVLKKTYPTSSYSENVSIWTVLTDEQKVRLSFATKTATFEDANPLTQVCKKKRH